MGERYRLKKDSYEFKAGALFEANGGRDGVKFSFIGPEYTTYARRGQAQYIVRKTLEDATDWFEPVYSIENLTAEEVDRLRALIKIRDA